MECSLISHCTDHNFYLLDPREFIHPSLLLFTHLVQQISNYGDS